MPGCTGSYPHLDFEQSGLSLWSLYIGERTVNNGVNWFGSGQFAGWCDIVTFANDPKIGSILPTIREGTMAVRLGSSTLAGTPYGGGRAQWMENTFVVSANVPFYKFSYALVLEDDGHAPLDSPDFEYILYKGTPANNYWINGALVIDQLVIPATDPNLNRLGKLAYQRWTCHATDLQSYVGQTVTVRFKVRHCIGDQHFGYAYIDKYCSELLKPMFLIPDSICPGSLTVIMDAFYTIGETDYFVSVEESDEHWARNPLTERSQWFAGIANQIDLVQFYASFGEHFKSNTYYRIKLAVKNSCEEWKEVTKLLYIREAPIVNAGQDVRLCNASGGPKNFSVPVGSPALPGYTYAWSPSLEVSDPYSSETEVSIDDPGNGSVHVTVWTLEAKAPNGCIARDTVTITVDRPLTVTVVNHGRVSCCERLVLLEAVVSSGVAESFFWPVSGDTTAQIKVAPPVAGNSDTHTVIVKNACGTKIGSVQVAADPRTFHGAFPNITAPNAIKVGHPNPQFGKWFCKDTTRQCGDVGSYNATGFRLRVFDRWGSEVVLMEGSGCGFTNCETPYWDGFATASTNYKWWQFRTKVRQGHALPNGVYTLVFELSNCDQGYTKVLDGFAITVLS